MSPTGVSPLLDPVAYATISPDLDAMKRAEDALRESEERFRSLVAQAAELLPARLRRAILGREPPRLRGPRLHARGVAGDERAGCRGELRPRDGAAGVGEHQARRALVVSAVLPRKGESGE